MGKGDTCIYYRGRGRCIMRHNNKRCFGAKNMEAGRCNYSGKSDRFQNKNKITFLPSHFSYL